MGMDKKNLLRFLVLSAVLIAILISVPKTIGLSRAGFDTEEILRQFFFYAVTGGFSLLGIILLFFFENRKKEGDSDYGSGLCFSSPDEKPSLGIFKRFGQFQIFLISMITFCAIGLFSYINRQVTFTGISVLAQQFSEIDSLLFSSFLIPVAENLDLAFLIALGIFGIRSLARRQDWDSTSFMGMVWLLVPIGGIFGIANHLLRYSGSEVALATVFIFWSVGTALTLITGSFIPFLCMHFANNFFFDLGRFINSEVLLIYGGLAIAVLVVLYFFIYRHKLLGGKNG